MNPTCEDFRLQMADALTGRLDVLETATLESHLAECADCRAHHQRLARTANLLSDVYPKSAVRVRQPFQADETGENGLAVPSSGQAGKPDLRRWYLAAAAAVLLVCAVVYNRHSQMPSPNTEIAQQPASAPYHNKEADQAPAAPQVAMQEAPKSPTVSPAPEQATTQNESPAPAAEPEVAETEVPDWEELAAEPVMTDEPAAPAVAQEARASTSEETASIRPGLPARDIRNEEAQNPEAAGTAALPGPRASRPPVKLESLTYGRPAREQISDAQGLAVLRRTGALVVYEPEHRIWRTVQSGEAIPYGARIRTGAGAQAELAFGESRLWLDAASDLVVARAADRTRRAALDHGRLRIDLLRPDAGFSVEAGGGVVELTGTIVEVEAATPRLAFVRTLEGHARVTPAGTPGAREPIQVVAGQEALLAAPGEEPLSSLPVAFRDRVKELNDAPDGRLAFKPAVNDWTKDLKRPAPKSRAVGQLIVRDESGRSAEPLHIARLSVEARIRGASALTRVDQSFRNDTNSTLEGTFYFPLPPGAALSRFAMYVDNEQKTLIEGEVVEREYARNVYESILRQKRDPALVEWMEGNLFKARIFPIPPHSLKRVILEYTQLLPATFDTRRYVFPLVSELTRKTPIEVFSLRAILETGDGTSFRRIESSSYPQTAVEGQGRRVALATLALRNLQPNEDFVLAISAPRKTEIRGETYGETGEDPYLLLGYQPRPDAAGTAAVQGRDILFVVETSGARTPADLDTQSQVLRAVLAGLDPARDRVALAAADVNLTSLTQGWVNTYANELDRAQAALDRRAPLGALDLESVLTSAAGFVARDRDKARQQMVVFIGSGIPALGTLDAAPLTERVVAELTTSGARFAGFPVGRTVDALVLAGLARRTNGLYLPLKGDEDIAETAFLAALSLQTPWVEAPTLSVQGATLTEIRPGELGAVLPGQEVFLHARLKGHPQSFQVTIAGRLNGNPYESRVMQRLPMKLRANPALGRFWARAQLDHLLAQPQTSQVRQDVVSLAKTWTLMTPYTSFLVLESEQDYARYEIKREQRRRIWRDDADLFSEPEPETVEIPGPRASRPQPAAPAGETADQLIQRMLRDAGTPELPKGVELRIYDVSDLTLTPQDNAGPDLQVQTVDPTDAAAGGASDNPFITATDQAQDTPANIADMIRAHVRPESWSKDTSIEEREGRLVVKQSAEVHAMIDQLLSNFRATQKIMVNVHGGFILLREADQAGADQMGVNDVPPSSGDAPASSSTKSLSGRDQAPPAAGAVTESALQAQDHLEAAKRLYKAFEYKAAQAELLRAVNLNQKDEKARELLVEVNDVLNKRQDRIQSAVQSLARSQQVAIQERMVTLDNRLDWGNRYVASAQEDPELTLAERIRRYQQAQDAFERARELVKWMPVGVDVSEQQHEAERMIKEVIHARRDLEVQLAEEDKQSAMELSISRATQEREREQRRVAVQLDEAKALFEVGEYERAEAVAGKILETDPTNAEAHALQVTADDRKHIKKAKWLEEEYNEQFQRQKELADNNLIPHEDYLVYPDNWAEIAQRTGHRVPVPSSGESDGERAKEKEPLTAGLNYYIKGHNARAGHEPDHAEDTGVPVPGFTKTPTNGPTSTFSTVGTITTGDARQSAPGNNAYIDSTVENKYGPTPQVRPRLDPNFPIDKAMVSRNADGTVTVVLDYEVSGDAFDPVIRKMPAAEYEALKREVEELRTKANAGTQASTEAGRAQKDDLASEELLKTIIERGKHGPKTAISETALCPICQKPLYLHTADGFSCTPPAGTVRMPIGIENAPARVDELTNVNALLESDMRRQLDAARSELARARSDKQKIELDLADQNRRISEAIQKGMPPEIFQKQGGEPQQRPLPSTDVSMKASTIDTEPRGTVGESELKRQLDAVRGELATVEREKKQIEQDLAEQTQRITSSLQRGVPMELFYSQDPEAFQKPLPDSRVLAIRPELDLVMLSVGAKDGAKPGYRMTIGRGEQYLAKAEIQKVYPDMCSARLFLKRGEVQVNDTAFSRVPGSGDSAKEGKKAARSPDAEEANRILQDYITYPEGWADTHPRAGDAGRARTGEPWMMDIQRRLSRRVSFEFRDTPLQEALTFLQTLSKVNITLDPKAATAPTTQLKITLRVTDMDMETALKWILRLAELDYELRPEGVFISTRELLRREQNDPPAPPAGTDGTKADEKKELADQMAAARKHLQEALAALPRTDVTARQRLRLFAELASLSTGADVYRVLNDGIANFGGEGPFAEALAKIFLQTARNEKDPAALEAALAFTTDSALRANMAARCGDLTAESEHRLALFARAYQESPDFLRAYAWNLTHAGKIKEATGLLEEALRKGLNEPWIVKQLEENYRAVEDQAGQLRVLTQAVAQRPREAEPRLQLARTLEALGRKTEALRELRLAREFRPEDLQNHRAYLALAERLEDRAAIEDALWGLLDRDWPNDRSVQSDAEKRWKKLTNEYRDAGQEVKVKELSEKLLRLKALDLVVRLSWDTDETDVDLHVKEPSGHETSYESKQSARGANLDRDIMNGYGPETYTLRRAAKGTYGISVNYYHGSRKTKATVTVTRHKGAPEEQTRTFEVRLERTGDTANVTEVVIE